MPHFRGLFVVRQHRTVMEHPTFLLAMSVVTALLALPLVFKLVPPNHLYGFRTPRTLANRELWYRVNFFCGCSMLCASLMSVVLFLVLPPSPQAFLEFVVPIAASIAASFVYLSRAA